LLIKVLLSREATAAEVEGVSVLFFGGCWLCTESQCLDHTVLARSSVRAKLVTFVSTVCCQGLIVGRGS